MAVSSDMTVYMLKFNYEAIHKDSLNDLEDETVDEKLKFVNLYWKANMNSLTTEMIKRGELP